MMAKVGHCQWLGKTFYAELIQERPGGSMLMKALTKGDRFVPGSQILVQPGEVVEWVNEVPPELVEPQPAPSPAPPQDQGGAVRPTQPPATGADKGAPMSSIDKIKALAQRSQDFEQKLVGDLDATMKRFDEVDAKKQAALAKQHIRLDATHANLDDMEKALDQLSNLPLDSSGS